jgi:polysaccharide chain length determinant protein (PEP-CTERM system associated)
VDTSDSITGDDVIPGRKYTPEDILRLAWYHKWIIIAGIVVFGSGAAVIAKRLPNQYRSETLILVIPQRVPDSYVRSTVTMRIEERLRSLSQEIFSRTRLETVINEFDLYPELRQTRPMESVVEYMRTKILVDTVRDDAFKITYTATTPRTAMIVTDRLASMFIDENTHDRSVMADSTNQFLESQLDESRARLITQEKTLEEFRRRYAGELPSQLQTNLQVIQGTQNQIQSVNESINRDRDRRLVLEKSVADALSAEPGADTMPLEPVAVGDPNAINGTRSIDQLERARNELRGMELRLRPEHPDVIAKKRLIAELERKAQQEAQETNPGTTPQPLAKPLSGAQQARQTRARQIQAEIEKLDHQIATKEADVARLRQAVSDYQHRVEAVPGHESELTDLMRDYETLQKSYTSLLAKKEESKISANLERQQVSEQFKILDRARLPQKAFSPDRLKIALAGAAFGLMLGVVFGAFLEYRDTSLRSEDEILRTLVLPVLAAIPMMTTANDRSRRRRVVFASVAATALTVAGLAVATLWRLGMLKGMP